MHIITASTTRDKVMERFRNHDAIIIICSSGRDFSRISFHASDHKKTRPLPCFFYQPYLTNHQSMFLSVLEIEKMVLVIRHKVPGSLFDNFMTFALELKPLFL